MKFFARRFCGQYKGYGKLLDLLFVTTLVLLIPFFSFAQYQNLKFDRIGIDQGLSDSNTICMLQDSRGFMWFGTRDGLNKYDGYTFTVYKNDPDDKHSIANNIITNIIEDKGGTI